MDNSHWITAHFQLLSVILFTAVASFTHNGVNNSQIHIRVPMQVHNKQEKPISKGDFQ